MKTKISKLLVKEHTVNGVERDPLISIYIVVTYRSQIIKQFKYKRWAEIPLTFRDFMSSPDTELREWDKPSALTCMHCQEYTLRRDKLYDL